MHPVQAIAWGKVCALFPAAPRSVFLRHWACSNQQHGGHTPGVCASWKPETGAEIPARWAHSRGKLPGNIVHTESWMKRPAAAFGRAESVQRRPRTTGSQYRLTKFRMETAAERQGGLGGTEGQKEVPPSWRNPAAKITSSDDVTMRSPLWKLWCCMHTRKHVYDTQCD